MKKSFIIHIDALDVLTDLTDEQAGQLFKAISEYHKTGKNSLTGLMSAVFIPFKNQFDRDAEKYESICERNKNNGLKGGRPKPRRTQKNPVGFSGTQKNPKEPDNDSDNDNDSKNKGSGLPDSELWFAGDVIRLTEEDFFKWVKMTRWDKDTLFDVLTQRDDWYITQTEKIRKNWFIATMNYLRKEAA